MSEPLDLIAGIRALLRAGEIEATPELERLITELEPLNTTEERARLETPLRQALPELRELRNRIPELLTQPLPPGILSPEVAAARPTLAPERAKGLLAELSEAWSRRDGTRVDAILRTLEAEVPGSIEMSVQCCCQVDGRWRASQWCWSSTAQHNLLSASSGD